MDNEEWRFLIFARKLSKNWQTMNDVRITGEHQFMMGDKPERDWIMEKAVVKR